MARPSTSRERQRREAADWLARLQGPASDAERAAFQGWYEADPAHAEAYDRVKARYETAGLLAQTTMGRDRALSGRMRVTGQRRTYAMAAGIAALLLFSAALLLGRPEALMPRAEAETLHYETAVGEIRQVSLPDGSGMTLDTDTRVTVTMRHDRRQVTIREGRARFDVAREDRRPFVVEAGEGRVTGQAGRFDVALHDGVATVQPIDGSVTLEHRGGSAAPGPLRLAAGQAVLISADGSRAPRQPGRSGALWPSGVLEFDATPLGQVVAEANRYSHAQIRLAEPSLARLRVNGTFRAGDSEGLARSLAAAFGLRLRRGEAFVLHPGGPATGPIQSK